MGQKVGPQARDYSVKFIQSTRFKFFFRWKIPRKICSLMAIKHPTAPCVCCYTTLMSAKQAINDELQGSVATYLRCGGVVNNQIKKGSFLSLTGFNYKFTRESSSEN